MSVPPTESGPAADGAGPTPTAPVAPTPPPPVPPGWLPPGGSDPSVDSAAWSPPTPAAPSWAPPTEAAPAWAPPTDAAAVWAPPTDAAATLAPPTQAAPAWAPPTEAAPAHPPIRDWSSTPPPAPPTGPPGPPGAPPYGAAYPPLGADPSRPPGGPARSTGTTVALALLATVAVLAVVAAVVVAVVRSRDASDTAATTNTSVAPSSTTTTTAPSTTSPSTSSAPTTSPPTTGGGTGLDPAVVQAEVANLSAFVEQTWGKPFKTPVDVEVVDDDAFTARLLATIDEERAELDKLDASYRALGLLPEGTSLYDVQRQLLSGGVLGYYDPETKELVVRGDRLSPYVRETIVHELTHALQDQWVDLDRTEYDDRKDEIALGLSALAEGDARRVEAVYRDQLSAADQRDRDREEARFGQSADLAGVPDIVIKQTLAPYELGEPLVTDLVRQGGIDALLAAYADPPTTSEQLLEPARYEARQGRADVARPPVDGELTDEGVFGALSTAFLLEEEVPSRTALQAARGWEGDWYVSYRRPNGEVCVRVDWDLDTPIDGQELRQALQQWATAQAVDGVDATVEAPAADQVRLTSCAGGPS